MKCPFCEKKVENEYEASSGCKVCVKDWTDNMNVDHYTD